MNTSALKENKVVEEINSFKGEYAFLSNFYYNHSFPVLYQGLSYPTAEHAYQAAKTLDSKEREAIRNAKSPGTAKRAGRAIQLRSDWEAVKLSVMYEVLLAKFLPHPALRELLVATGSARLVEGNTWGDLWWGMVDGEGQNWLGKLLMMVRDVASAGFGL